MISWWRSGGRVHLILSVIEVIDPGLVQHRSGCGAGPEKNEFEVRNLAVFVNKKQLT
jgi:hypothetical protein